MQMAVGLIVAVGAVRLIYMWTLLRWVVPFTQRSPLFRHVHSSKKPFHVNTMIGNALWHALNCVPFFMALLLSNWRVQAVRIGSWMEICHSGLQLVSILGRWPPYDTFRPSMQLVYLSHHLCIFPMVAVWWTGDDALHEYMWASAWAMGTGTLSVVCVVWIYAAPKTRLNAYVGLVVTLAFAAGRFVMLRWNYRMVRALAGQPWLAAAVATGTASMAFFTVMVLLFLCSKCTYTDRYGLRTMPLIGLVVIPTHARLAALLHKFGTVVMYSFGRRVVTVYQPEDVAFVQSMPRGAEWRSWTIDWMGAGIFNSDGAEWKTQRKCLAHLFSNNRLRTAVLPFVAESVQEWVNELEPNVRWDAQEALRDSTARIAVHFVYEGAPGTLSGHIHDAMYTLFSAPHRRLTTPWWRWAKRWKVGKERGAAAAMLCLKRYATAVRVGATTRSIVNTRADSELWHIMMAATDTTASLLTSVLVELSEHPEAQHQLRAEAAATEGIADWFKRFKAMPQMRAVLYETLRLHPPVPRMLRTAASATVLPSGTAVRAGDTVITHIYAGGRDPRRWGVDAADWRPSRWAGRPPPSEADFPVFAIGERRCLGRQMALVSATIHLTTLIERWAVRVPQTPRKRSRGIFLGYTQPVWALVDNWS